MTQRTNTQNETIRFSPEEIIEMVARNIELSKVHALQWTLNITECRRIAHLVNEFHERLLEFYGSDKVEHQSKRRELLNLMHNVLEDF